MNVNEYYFLNRAWEDYRYWSTTDKNIFKKINGLIKECTRTPFEGVGKPKPLKYELAGT
jgi:toxin YoeB